MMRVFLKLLPVILCILQFALLPAQERDARRKPVLIRADRTTDTAKTDVEEEVIIKDPQQAKEHLEIGDFYFGRDNYKAAEERYRDAIKFHPEWAKAYEKLIKALEKQRDYEKAIEVCDEFMARNPQAKEKQQFQDLARDLKRKGGT